MTGTRLAAAVALALLGACRGADSPPAATPTTTTPPVAASASPLVDPGESTTSTAPARVAAGARPGATTDTAGHRLTTTTVAGSTTISTTALRAAGAKCPDPRTCDIYKLTTGKGWRPGPDGVARIPVSINPTPPAGSSLTADTVEADIRAMMAMWEEASPTVRFTYLGRTSREPQVQDGHSDLAYGHSVLERRDGHGFIVEADVIRTPVGDQVGSYPCDWHRDGGCGPVDTGQNDTRNLIAHELGHVLGAADLDSAETNELTMDHGHRPVGDRRRVTLGLGDVLAVRHLYPCGCPLPRIYVP